MTELISSRSNPMVKKARSLRQKKGRDESGLFLVEGIHLVGEAAAAGWEIETLFYAPDQLTSDFGLGLVADLSLHSVRAIALTSDLFSALAEKDNPQGLLAILHQRHMHLDQLKLEKFHLGTAVVSPQDPGNVGTILRTLDAVDADGLILLDGGVELFHPTVIRSSMGTLFWKPVVEATFTEFIHWVRKNGISLIGSSAHSELDYREIKPGNQSIMLLLGSEQKGLTQAQKAACDAVVSLPMRGRANSINLAVAAGILLYALKGK